MSTHFDQLIADVKREAQDEGLQAVGELEQLRQEFELASARIASRRSAERSEVPRSHPEATWGGAGGHRRNDAPSVYE